MRSKYSKLIDNYFSGITEEDIEAHKIVMKKVRKNTDELLRRATKNIQNGVQL